MWPTEIRLSADRKTLSIVFDDGSASSLSALVLRTESPSAEVQGHHGIGGQKPSGKEEVRMTKVEPVGNYAVRLIFDDGHDSGLYTWDYLSKLAAR